MQYADYSLQSYYLAREAALHGKLQQLESSNLISCPSHLAYMKEFGTVELKFGRRTGATYWTLRAALALSKFNPKSKIAIILPFRRILKQIKKDLERENEGTIPANLFLLVEDPQWKCLIGHSFDVTIADPSFSLSNDDYESICMSTKELIVLT